MSLREITGPSVEPVTTNEVKLDARIDENEFDAKIENVLIPAMRRKAEHETGRLLITQTWELVLDEFPDNEIRIGKAPVQSITSIQYYDTSGTLQTLSTDNFVLDAVTMPGWILLADGYEWPATQDVANAVIIRFVAGYGSDPEDVPEPVRLFIRMKAASMVDPQSNIVLNQNVGELPRDYVDGLLDPYRLKW